MALCFLCYWHKEIFMNAKKENYWFIFRLLLLMNVVLITVIVLAHPRTKVAETKQESCSSVKKIRAEAFNAITVRLM
jgi:hypothetical protein